MCKSVQNVYRAILAQPRLVVKKCLSKLRIESKVFIKMNAFNIQEKVRQFRHHLFRLNILTIKAPLLK